MKRMEKKRKYPVKTTLNLADWDRALKLKGGTLALFLTLAVLVGVFARFGVIDQLGRVSGAQAEQAAAQQQLDQLKSANADSQTVTREYSRYFYNGFTDEEQAAVDRMAILNLLEQQLMNSARVNKVSVSGNTVSVELDGLTLEQLSELISRLKQNDIVQDVSVYTAGSEANQGTAQKEASISMTISLKQPEKDGGGQ